MEKFPCKTPPGLTRRFLGGGAPQRSSEGEIENRNSCIRKSSSPVSVRVRPCRSVVKTQAPFQIGNPTPPFAFNQKLSTKNHLKNCSYLHFLAPACSYYRQIAVHVFSKLDFGLLWPLPPVRFVSVQFRGEHQTQHWCTASSTSLPGNSTLLNLIYTVLHQTTPSYTKTFFPPRNHLRLRSSVRGATSRPGRETENSQHSTAGPHSSTET